VPAIATAFAGCGLIEAQRLRRAGRDGVGALRRVVEALGAHGCLVAQAALHLIGDGEGDEQLTTGGVSIFGCGEHGGKVVARLAGLGSGEVGVVEVEVADERPVVEGGPVRRSLTAPDQRAARVATEVFELCANRADRRRVERAKRTAQRVEDTDLQFLARGI
jgi:hypothetical protein